MRDIDLGATIARKRRAAGITQGELAARLGVTKAAVSKWELGQSLPDVALLPRIAALFAPTFASSAATSCLQAGDDVRATAYLERFVSLIEGIDGKHVALGVRKSVLYDRAPQMAGVSPDQVGMANAQLGEIDVRQQCAQAILACPEWAERADDGRFGPLLDRLGAIR